MFLIIIVFSNNVQAQKNLYQNTLLSLCDAMLTTQINEPTDSNFGAFICPSINPDNHPIHSRAAEMMYPLAVAYKLTGKVAYRNAAIKVGNWLITIQETGGKNENGWSENWPDPAQKGWFGTTTDQLVSMAGAYAIIKPYLKPAEIKNWNETMEKAASFILNHFPIAGNMNYNPTGAATLLLTYKSVDKPKQIWLKKADSLMAYTVNHLDANHFLEGEGNGIDEGYNIAQSIGYMALYAILKNDVRIKQIASDLLKVAQLFVYPNGSVDNSWGTRSFKWSYESGTKTAPGVYFSFALLADMNPAFEAAGLQCLNYLRKNMQGGWITYGPHAYNHNTSNPPCNYSTFARAQSIALAIEYGAKAQRNQSSFPAQKHNWYHFFPQIKVAVIRTNKMMATVSAYGEISRYPRPSVCRGGSITNLWYEGFGANGFLQSSSTASYTRIEALHMPVEKDLLPLTARIEYNKDSFYYSNLFEDSAQINVLKEGDHINVMTAGNLKTIKGAKSKVTFNLTHRFYDAYLIKEITVSGDSGTFNIIEPIVKDEGTTFQLANDSTVLIKTAQSNKVWELKIMSSSVPYTIVLGTNVDQYWSPFPGVEAFPITIRFSTLSGEPQKVKYMLKENK